MRTTSWEDEVLAFGDKTRTTQFVISKALTPMVFGNLSQEAPICWGGAVCATSPAKRVGATSMGRVHGTLSSFVPPPVLGTARHVPGADVPDPRHAIARGGQQQPILEEEAVWPSK